MRTLVLISVLLLGALPISAEDTSHGPIPAFASCPDTLTADCGDTITYQFQIINAKSGQPHPDARYFMAKGYGHIDSMTGMYTYWSHRNEANDAVLARVGAYFTTSKRPDTVFCRFTAIICPQQLPHIYGDCPITATSFRRGTYTQFQLEGDTYCGTPVWSVIPPPVSGIHAQISPTGLLYLSGITLGEYTATVILTDPCGADTCEVNFTITDEYPYDVRIEKKRMVLQGGYENVRVTIDSVLPVTGLGGFDLLITFDHTAISLQSVTEGDIFEKCGWEYFTYRYGADGNCPTCPPGLVRVIGIAETNNGDDHPNCGYPETLPATLFTMKFLVSNDRSLVCQYVPIRFFWRDCEDNRLMCDSGFCNYFFAGRVFDSLNAPYPIDSMAGAFPGTNGPPYQACETIENIFPTPHGLVDFYHGGLEIVCADTLDNRGDLNLNGFAFETVDITLFARYFVYGSLVFTINLPAQIAASEINGDNVPLTIEDFCYMYRIVAGGEIDLEPISALDTAVFQLTNGELTQLSDDTLGAIAITVEGNAIPTLTVDRVGMQFAFDGQVTRIFIAPLLTLVELSDSAYILPGTILTGLEDHEILSIQTATYRGGKLYAQLEPPIANRFKVSIGRVFSGVLREPIQVDVTLEQIDYFHGIDGFNFLIAYDAQELSFQNLVKGELLTYCDWEYFTASYETRPGDSAHPSGLIRVIGLAETNNGDIHPEPNCPSATPARLFTLFFKSADDCYTNCYLHPIRFYWQDCDDNTIASMSGRFVSIADRVFDLRDPDNPLPPEDAVLPGYGGIPEGQCDIVPRDEPMVLRNIDFHHGYIDFICSDSVDGRGDIDLNGRSFEIADETLFTGYLFFGGLGFLINPASQLAATDINLDGQPGTIEDFVLQHRITHGLDTFDCHFTPPPDSPDTAFFSLAHDTLVVSTSDSLGAVLLSVVGNIWPRDPAPGMTIKYNFDGAVTRILIAPDIENPAPDAYILAGPIFRGLNLGQILSIESATWRGAKITSHFSDDPPDIAITIGKVEAMYQSPTVTVPVKLQHLADHISLGGFDLLFTFEDSALAVEDVTPGSLHELGGWEYFNWHLENTELCGADCRGGLLRVVGLAETNTSLSAATSAIATVGQTLFNITFRTGDWRLYECLDIPVNFYWTGCADNQCLTTTGSPLRERFVYSHRFPYLTDTHYPENSATFPGIKGVPVGTCDYSPFEGIDFYSGSVHFYCEPELDPIGDLNLNGLAYEVADETLFADYFLNGLAAFTINPLAQEATSDINRDGTTLTVEDYVLMHRIINGWALPHDNPPDDPDTVHFLHAFGPLYAATDDTLGAIAIVVAGNITPVAVLPNMTMEYAFDGTNTHIFIHPPHGSTDSTAYILAGPIVDLQNALTILSISVSTHRGAYIPSRLDNVSDADDQDPNLPGSFALHQNYPNPFNAGTVISFDLPRSSEVKLEIINVLGNIVYRQSGTYSAGTHSIDWQGTTNSGRPVASGIYYYRLTAGGNIASRKMLLLK